MEQETSGILMNLSSELADVVERVGASVVRVDDGSRLTATGVLWSGDGIVVTTSHGVERDEDIKIVRGDGTALPAVLVGRDPDTDVAALRVQATGLPAIPQAAADDARPGNLALAVGRPGEAGLQVTLGMINSRIETQTNGKPGYLLYSDATLYPGFSGGPMVDMAGRIIGLNNLMFGRRRGVAVGTPVIAEVVTALLAHGRVQRGYLGVRTQPVALPDGLKQSLGQESALLLTQVENGSAGEQGGLMIGDLLIRLNETTLRDVDDLRRELRSLHAGQSATVKIVRGGETRDLTVTLGVEK